MAHRGLPARLRSQDGSSDFFHLQIKRAALQKMCEDSRRMPMLDQSTSKPWRGREVDQSSVRRCVDDQGADDDGDIGESIAKL